MAIKVPKSSGSKLGRTETVSIRLDPRLNYLCELAARSQRRTKSSYIEATIAERIQTQVINRWREPEHGEQPETFGDQAELLWHVRESQRLVSLALIAPELMTFEEQHIWALIEENQYFWRYKRVGERWDRRKELEFIIRERVEAHWEQLVAVAMGEESPDSLPRADSEKEEQSYASDLDGEIPF